jgi:putative salt-induced outer membrane protein
MLKTSCLVRFILLLVFCLHLGFQEVHAACDPVLDPCAPKKVLDQWNKSISAGLNITKGNSETTVLNLGGKATRESNRNIYDLMAAYNYGEDSNAKTDQFGQTNRNDFRSQLRYDRLVNERWFAGFGTFFLYDEIADVDYRLTLDPGFGYYFWKNPTVSFRLEGGPSYVFEREGGITHDYLAPRIGDKFEWIISCTSKVYQSASVLMDVENSDNYLVIGEVGIESALATNLALVFTIRQTYDNVPAKGREKEDLQAITSLKVAL